MVFLGLGTSYEVAPGVTAERIKQIELDMTKEEVIQILGKPLKVESFLNGKTSLIYAKSYVLPMDASTRINLDSNNRVCFVMAKDHNEASFYSLMYEWDDINKKYTDKIVFEIHEEIFNEYFK